MPYRSDAQRKFFHTNTAKKAGITDKEVNEFDQASKGTKLPEHVKKMAYGGETNPKHETLNAMENNPTAGFADGGPVNPEGGFNAPGLKDATVSDFVLPLLLGKLGIPPESNMSNPALMNAPEMEGVAGDMPVDAPLAPGVFSQMAPRAPMDLGRMSKGGMVNDPAVMAGLAAIASQSMDHDHSDDGPMTAIVVEPEDGKEMQHFDDGGDVLPAVGNALQGALSPLSMPNLQQGAANTVGSPSIPPAQLAAMLQSNGAASPVTSANAPQMGLPFMSQNPAPIPPSPIQAPPIHQIMQKLQQTPNTNYNFYKNMTAEDRAALLQKLTQQQHSGGNLVASGVAGLGDAIARSFGHQNTNYQQDIQNQAQNAKEQAVGALDTERVQKVQDMQANLGLQENDPNSPYSSGMRQFVTAFTGKQVPSGVSASQLKGAFSDIAKIFDSQLTAAAAQTGHKVEAGKAVANESFFSRLADSISGSSGEAANKALLNEAGGNSSSNGGWSVVK